MTHYVRPPHHELPRGTRTDGLGHDGTSLARPPRKSTAPPGLFAPAPEVVVAKRVKAPVKDGSGSNEARRRPCGTEAAAKRHVRSGEPLCDVCQAGRDARRKTPYRPKRTTTPGQRCGTKQGYEDHLAHGETTCQPCKDAMAADARRRYALRAAALNPPTKHEQCGSVAGRAKHRRLGEKPCNACRLAHNDANRKRHNSTERGAA